MPARIAESTKHVRGTSRPGRQIAPAALARLTRAPAAPTSLSDKAKGEWERLAPALIAAGTLTNSDLRGLELLADTLATSAELAEIVRHEGTTVAAGSGGTKAHPALAGLAQARALARTLLNDFGLTPRGRGAVDAAPDAQEPEKPKHGLASFR